LGLLNRLKVNKRKLWRFISRDVKHFVHNLHIFAVISILVDEILKDLKEGKEIKIVNFGTLKIEKTKPKKFRNIKTAKFEISKPKNKLKLKLSRRLKKFVAEKKDEELK
jgi:nucleoid DNA-binding protein